MILTCDHCHARYRVSAKALEPEGRTVRCTACGEEWFQPPEMVEEAEPPEDPGDDIPIHDDGLEIDPIPESVRPVPESDMLPAAHVAAAAAPDRKGAIAGYAAAALVFLLIGGAFFALHKPLTSLWPSTITAYDMAGLKTEVDGERLIFDSLKAVVAENPSSGIPVLTISGNILNLSPEDSTVPMIQTSMIMADGNIADSWLVDPAQTSLTPQGQLHFETAYPEVPQGVKEVNVRFVPGSKIAGPAADQGAAEAEHAEPDHHEPAADTHGDGHH